MGQNFSSKEVKKEVTSEDTQDVEEKTKLVTREKCDESIVKVESLEECAKNKLKEEACEAKHFEHFDKASQDLDEAEKKFAWKDRSRTSEEFELSLEINDDDFVQTVKEG